MENTLTLYGAVTGVVIVVAILVQLDILRSFSIEVPIGLYAIQSFFVAVFSATVAIRLGKIDLIVIAILTIVIKVWLIPSLFRYVIRRSKTSMVIPMAIKPPLSIIFGLLLTAVSFLATISLKGDFTAAISAGLAIIAVGFQIMATRHHVIPQIIALLTQENGIFLITIAMAPGLPILVGILILLDVLVAVVVFGILIRFLDTRLSTTSTHELSQLKG
ncbi:MAG: hypothetical protein M1396_01545 [Chloroflexi bacterium]|nr:hypothetical protein [Chloroflexota bacterium]